MTHTITMKRGQAERLLDDIRQWLAERVPPEEIERRLADPWGAHGSRVVAIPPLTACDGPAHKNAHIDNCPDCAPRWGWRGPTVKVR